MNLIQNTISGYHIPFPRLNFLW